ncbi:MAG: GNAT family N-acetyltransferase [Bacteroides sp.]|nr:GNAT family N-acetyltransferase [Bacteroides sp.]
MDIRIRALEPSDAKYLYDAENDHSLWGVSGTVAPYSLHALSKYAESYDADPFASGQLRLVITGTDGSDPVGLLDFYDISLLHAHAWVGIYIRPEFRRQGAALAALKFAAAYAHKRLKLKQLAAKVLRSSTDSLALFRRAGYDSRGVLTGWYFADGVMQDVELLTLPLS